MKLLARKRRRRGRAERRLLQQVKTRNRARARGREITVATHNVRTMVVDGTHEVGRALDVLSVYDRLGCDVIGLQETRRSGHSAFSQTGYLEYCSGKCGGENRGKKGQGGVGLAVRTSITRAARSPKFISDRLVKVALQLRGRAKAVTFFVVYAPTQAQNASSIHAFWTSLNRAVEKVLKREQLFVLMDANARTERREKGHVGSPVGAIFVPIPTKTGTNLLHSRPPPRSLNGSVSCKESRLNFSVSTSSPTTLILCSTTVSPVLSIALPSGDPAQLHLLAGPAISSGSTRCQCPAVSRRCWGRDQGACGLCDASSLVC